MWPDRRLIDLFKIEHPVVLAPMAGFSTPKLAASVCSAGGLGSIGCAMMPPELAAKTIRELRALTDKPINVNFSCHIPAKADADRERAWTDRLLPFYRELGVDDQEPRHPRLDMAPFGDAMCTVVERTRPEVVSFHFGLPDPALLGRVKAAGCRVMSSATTVAEALWLEAHGVDAVIAQGYEAGGHRGMFLAPNSHEAIASQPGALALIPQVVDAVRVPVVAAGGIADGRGIVAAFALGAAGVQLGTAYLLCPEAATPLLHRDALRQAPADATLLTNVFTGRPARVLANRLVLEVGPVSDRPPDFPLPLGALAPLRAKAEQQDSSDFTPLWSGQAARLGREMSAAALTRKLAHEAREQFKQLYGGPMNRSSAPIKEGVLGDLEPEAHG
jgi:nitronate monooxygenase